MRPKSLLCTARLLLFVSSIKPVRTFSVLNARTSTNDSEFNDNMGRGEYYKNKYGGGGRGGDRGGRGGDRGRGGRGGPASGSPRGGGSFADLRSVLQQIDGRQYPTYHDLETPNAKGWVNSEAGFTLYVGRAQSDPFAPPTRCRVVVNGTVAQLPPSLYSNRIRTTAAGDFLLRTLYANCRNMGADNAMSGKGWSGPKGGDVQVMEPCQHVLEQSGVTIDPRTGDVTAQVTINLPARGRTVLGHAAAQIFDEVLPNLVRRSLCSISLDSNQLQQHVDSVEDQHWLQGQLEARGLVAFVRNGAILPRASGVEDLPMSPSTAIPFQSPEHLEVSFDLPTLGAKVSGMGIPKGVTLICGGGFHGKSTLLQALQLGVYCKIPGDGREFCVTSPNAAKIRAEDGRCVTSVDISPFINNLPFGKDTTNFSTPDASGSTSQASNIVEAIEAQADLLLIDEDTAATNFMIRDDKMVQLVAADKEPITPFVRLVRSLYEEIGISSIMVIGGSGDFFDVADNVLVADCYRYHDATDRAKQIAAASASTKRASEEHQHHYEPGTFQKIRSGDRRFPMGTLFNAGGKTKVLSKTVISYGDTEVNLAGLEQLVTKSQTNAISATLQRIPGIAPNRNLSLNQVLSELEENLDRDGFDSLAPGQLNGHLARPRMLEMAAAINRFRKEGSIVQR